MAQRNVFLGIIIDEASQHIARGTPLQVWLGSARMLF